MSHHTVSTEEVGAVKTTGHSAGLSGLAAGAVGALQLSVVNPGHSVVWEEAGHASRSELTVGVTAGTRDLLGVFLQQKNTLGFCEQLGKLFLETVCLQHFSLQNTFILKQL